MRAPERGEFRSEAVVADPLAVLRASAAVANDPEALRALDEIERRLDPAQRGKSQRLARAAQIVNASLDLDAVLRHALELAIDVMNAERGSIVLRDAGAAAFHNMTRAEVAGPESAPHAIVARVLETGEALFTTDAQTDPRWDEQQVVPLHVRSIACVPLRVRGEILGAVYLDSRLLPGLFDFGDREMLATFAYQAALAIENARIYAEERGRVERISALQAFQTRILDAIANGVITLSPLREITTFNRAAEATFGIGAETMYGKAAFALAPLVPDLPEMLDTFFASGGVQLHAEVDGTRADGTRITLDLRLSPLDSPEGKGVAIVVNDITKQRRLEVEHDARVEKDQRVRASFSRYLAPHVVESLLDDPSSVRLGGERKRATMLFADIRGFTSLAAETSPERVVEILNRYFDEAVKIVFEFDGMLDKFYGDGLMAVFGTPRGRDDDAARAVEAAIKLHAVVARLGPLVDYPVQISVGLATGDVVAGHVGSSERMDYTVIGDAVNLANGLQSAAPPGAIYLDEATVERAGLIALPLHRLGARVKGRSDLITAYAIFPNAAHTFRERG
jgi:adenylate cyclase